ncbi:NAD-dependent epimerase/dehydratase family protein [Streptomyces colonosanans]|uniref:NAD(P)-binding domain-containing protein n=1 Tax=Streptomyces colonosanans TaxID=1428652 RepID=A0A1S2Q0H7_9ACTN|nr:NAD(P)H-binding protein [Streptomyces colonosanans]OIJ99617.1 hypothetical protein BIV24_04605 [Streptomyces colonosanans]
MLALFAEEGVEVNALVLEDPGDLPARLVVKGDAADPATVRQALAGVDAVVHLAAIPTPRRHPAREVFAVNTLSTFTVLEEAGRAGIRHAVLGGGGGVHVKISGTPKRSPPGARAPVDRRGARRRA